MALGKLFTSLWFHFIRTQMWKRVVPNRYGCEEEMSSRTLGSGSSAGKRYMSLSAWPSLWTPLLILLDPTGGKLHLVHSQHWYHLKKASIYQPACPVDWAGITPSFSLFLLAPSVMLGTQVGIQWLWTERLKRQPILTRKACYLKLAVYEWQWQCSKVKL